MWVKILNETISKQILTKQRVVHAMETQSVQLLLLLCAVSTCWGQGNLVDKLDILSVISQLIPIYELCIIP